jgi:uncharacterized membrane protein YbhN (UPF0104 family)
MKKRLKTTLALLIIATTIGAFGYYIRRHPETIDQLRHMPPITVVILLALYSVSFLAYVAVTRVSLAMYNKVMSKQENLLFNAYSALINFFGPGQSGPIFRAAYLKKRHGLGIKQFMLTILMYLGFYGVISVLFVTVGSRPWWQTGLVMLVAIGGSLAVVRWYKTKKNIVLASGFGPKNIGLLFAATLLQVAVLAVVYGIELRQVGAGASIGQILSYTGVTNLTLFVALTPGAIGIREAFLVFSQHLHGIDSTTIVAANIIDRSVYLLFLGLLFLLVVGTHAKDKLHVSQLKLGTKDEKAA